jgi:hypothetical protein
VLVDTHLQVLFSLQRRATVQLERCSWQNLRWLPSASRRVWEFFANCALHCSPQMIIMGWRNAAVLAAEVTSLNHEQYSTLAGTQVQTLLQHYVCCHTRRPSAVPIYEHMRHYATSRKVSGSIPDVTGFFTWPNPSSRTMVLGSTQPRTEMSTSNLPGRKGRPARKAGNLTAICESTVYKMWELRRFTTLRASMACYRIALPFFLTVLFYCL